MLLNISLILGATAISAGSHSKNYEFPRKDCQEMYAGIGGLLEEADKEWAYLEKNPDAPVTNTVSIVLSHPLYELPISEI